jgi:hypothetical protein
MTKVATRAASNGVDIPCSFYGRSASYKNSKNPIINFPENDPDLILGAQHSFRGGSFIKTTTRTILEGRALRSYNLL